MQNIVATSETAALHYREERRISLKSQNVAEVLCALRSIPIHSYTMIIPCDLAQLKSLKLWRIRATASSTTLNTRAMSSGLMHDCHQAASTTTRMRSTSC